MDKEKPINRLSIRNLSVGYVDDKLVLDNLCLDIGRGEIVGIIGESGCGKSTLLNSIVGFAPIKDGFISLNGTIIMTDGKFTFEEWEIRRNISIVFQDFKLIPHMKCISNMCLGLIYSKGVKKNFAYEKAIEVAKKLDIEDVLEKYPSEISGGQKQRVSLARAILMEPDVLLLDEVTSAIDPLAINNLINLLRDLKNNEHTKDISILLVTHNLKFANDYCSKLAFISGGKIVESSSPDLILTNPISSQLKKFIDASKYLI
jgi:polar amino acid transport system ATP-binding protein